MGKLKTIWENIKAWAVKTALPWLKKGAIQIINVFIVFFGYGKLDDASNGDTAGLLFAAFLVGLWAFILAVYWLFWKLLGMDKVIMPLIKKLFTKKEK